MLEARFGHPENERMSPHDRVACTLALQQPDRVPFDFWAVPETIDNLKRYLALNDDEELLRLLGVDCRILEPDYSGPELQTLPDGSFYNTWGAHYRKVRNEYAATRNTPRTLWKKPPRAPRSRPGSAGRARNILIGTACPKRSAR